MNVLSRSFLPKDSKNSNGLISEDLAPSTITRVFAKCGLFPIARSRVVASSLFSSEDGSDVSWHGALCKECRQEGSLQKSTHGIGVVDQSLDDEYSPANCSFDSRMSWA